MRRFLWALPLGLGLALAGTARSQPTSVLLDGSAPPPTAAPSGLPAGVVPDRAGAVPVPPPPNPFPLTPAVGPWLVCAGTYMGPDAPELARQLCLELRHRHNMAAYIFNHADEARRKQRAESDEQLARLRERYPGLTELPGMRRTVRIQEQCAVLVGGFPDPDSAKAAVKVIKTLPTPKLDLGEGKSAYDQVNFYEPDPTDPKKAVLKGRIPVNPFHNAIVVHNPTVPQQKQTAKFDPLWAKLNADEDYSLLRCPKAYTLVVKEYHGTAVIQQPGNEGSAFLKALGMGKETGQGLAAAAMQAHELARVLRHPSLGFDSYVLHTRDRSIVTVGGFKALHDADMQRVQRQLASLKFNAARGGSDPIGLMANPMPMEVPRP